ncbi:hypothetical protein P9B03_13840 [Metasolibacillus meyeri]|uniref:Uncharacterized protein n=1 Tax=Metasolibacillus meyeri TaxID=1071052 RepID=A0AAW9NWW0_9BACL|nr:hypothetical protein [Metasolibacillus meyeri]MEC1179576.1 hypothetical protein [Metasolibacillus meyeri]
MQNILERILKNLPFKQLEDYWGEFKPVAFAIFDDKEVFLFNHPKCKEEPYIKLVKTEEFYACTCILFEGVPTAIVDTSLYDSFEVIYSLLVHESFHVFQHLSEESRYPNEIVGFNYPIDFKNIQLRIIERKSLFEAYITTDLIERRKKINEFITYREKRLELFSDYVEYENLIETIEGPAFYVEYQALKDISCSKENVINKYAEQLLDNNLSHINIRGSCYNSGLCICLLLDGISEEWKMKFAKSKLDLYHFFREVYSTYNPTELIIPDNSEEVAEIMNIAQKNKLTAFNRFNESEGIKLTISGSIKIVGFDPMNITQLNMQAIHHNFLKLSVNNKEYFIDKPVFTTFENNFRDVQLIELFLDEPPIHIGNRLIIKGIGEFEGSIISKESTSIHIAV